MSVLQRWIKHTFRADRTPHRASKKKRTTRLNLEPLEDRWLPSTPSVTSISFLNPTGQYTNAATLTYAVTFSEPVNGVAAGDFQVVTTNSIKTTSAIGVSGAAGSSVYDVSVGVVGDGTAQLNLVNNLSITSVSSGTPLLKSFSGPAYAVDQTGPFIVSINRSNPAGGVSSATSVTYAFTFNEPVTGVVAGDFTVATGNPQNVSPALTVSPTVLVSGGPTVYAVTVNGISGDGTVGLNFVENTPVTSLSGSPLVGNGGVAFSARTSYATGAYPAAVAAADLRGDGITDLIVSNRGGSFGAAGSTISVLLGNGDGTFHAPVTYATAAGANASISAPYGLTVADVNGDGIPDLVVANEYGVNGSSHPSNTAVLIGNGDGTFQAPVTYATGNGTNGQSAQVQVADVNGDGMPDIIVQNRQPTTINGATTGLVSVLINAGHGTFLPQQTYATVFLPEGRFAVADLNGDGHPDIVEDNVNYGLSVLLGNGDGTFQAQVTYTVPPAPGASPHGVTVGDVNGDGIPDLVVAPSSKPYIGVFLGNGNGTFQAMQTFSTAIAGLFTTSNFAPYDVTVADVNGDGKADLVAVSGSSAVVLLGNGNGTFQPPQTFAAGPSTSFVAVADLNGDGSPDLAIVNGATAGGVSVLLGEAGGGSFTGQVYTIEQTPTVTITSEPTLYSSATTASFTFVANNPSVGGPGNQTNFIQYSIDGSAFTLANSPLNLSGLPQGSPHTIQFEAVDTNGVTGPVTSYTWTIGTTPLINSINYLSPSGPTTSASTISYQVTFSEPVTGVVPADFKVATTNSTQANSTVAVSGGPTTYTVTITGVHGYGTLQLDLINNTTIKTVANNSPLGGAGNLQGQIYNIVDVNPYLVSIIPTTPAARVTNTTVAVFTVTFSEPVFGVSSSNFSAGKWGSFAAPVISVMGSGAIYTVTVSSIAGNGALNLSLANSTGIHDASGNSLAYPQSPLSFTNQATFSTLSSTVAAPASDAVADLNGDGKADLVVASASANAISVTLGNGNGTFQAPLTYFAQAPSSLAIADVNGDGIPDIVAGSLNSYNVSVLFGNGDGTFQAARTVAAGQYPKTAVVADVNGDGIPDIVVADFGHISGPTGVNNAVGILLGNGNGTFQAEQTYVSGVEPIGLAVGDLNDDGYPDIAVTNQLNSTVGVLLNNGNGTFQAQQSYLTGSNPVSVAIGDLNGDGKPDLLVAAEGSGNFANGQIDLFLGNGDGTFQAAQSFTVAKPTQVFIADITGDGINDMVFNSYNNNIEYIVPGIAGGSFGAKQSFFLGAHPQAIALADVNGDALPDLVSVNVTNSSVSVLLNTFDPVLQLQSPQTFAAANPNKLAIGDLNGDGIPDLVFTSVGSTLGIIVGNNPAVINVVLGNGNGTYKQYQTYVSSPFPAQQFPTGILLADVNGDGKLDIVVTESPSGGTSPKPAAISVLMGNGDGTFQALQTYAITSPTITYPSFVQAADVNGDGKPDLLVTSSVSNNIGVLLNNGDGTFQLETVLQTFATNTKPTRFTYADVNGDGFPDLVITKTGGGSGASLVPPGVIVMLGNGNGTFQAPMSFATGGTTPYSVAVADLNGDGHADLAVANQGTGTVGVLLGNGDGTFQAFQTYYVGASSPKWMTVADMNGDGIPDLVVATTQGADVLLGNGNGTFQSPQIINPGSNPQQVGVADLNGDGAPDLVSGYANNGFGYVVLNNVYEIDQTPPTATITSGPTATTRSTSATFTFTGSDPKVGGVSSGVAYFQYQLDSGSYTTATSPLTLTGLSPGSHTFRVEAVDNAGNVSAPASYMWAVANPALGGLPVVNGSAAARTVLSATGNGATATITTATPHGFWVGELVTLTGTTPGGPGGLAGTFTVTGVPSATTFQFVSTYNGSQAFTSATVTASLAGVQRSMVDSIVYNFTEPVTLTAAAFTITAIQNSPGSTVGVVPTVHVAAVPFTNEWVVTFTDPVNLSVIGNSIANGAYTIAINPALVTAVSDGQNLASGETDTFYRLYGDVTGLQSVKNVDANAFNRAWGNFYYTANFNPALDYNDDGKYTNIDANAFNRAFNTRYSVTTTI